MTHEWMRQAAIDILRYLPEFLANDKAFKATNDADSKEHNTIRIDLQELLNQFFIASATYGLADWENLVGIDTDQSLDLDARRQTVMAKLQNPESVTESFLTNLVNRYIADKQGTILSYPEEYRIEILYHGGQILDYEKLRTAISTYIPAHIGYKLVAITNGFLDVHTAGTVQCAIENIMDMSTNYSISIDDTTINYAGAVVHNYKYLPISGGAIRHG